MYMYIHIGSTVSVFFLHWSRIKFHLVAVTLLTSNGPGIFCEKEKEGVCKDGGFPCYIIYSCIVP